MKKLSYFCSLFLAFSFLAFCGCGLISDAVREGVEQTKLVQSGTTIQGEGFSIRVPRDGYYLVRDNPIRGALCLRAQGNYYGGSYNVYPFTLSTPALSLEAALQAHMKKCMNRTFLRDYKILSQHTNVWQGSDSCFHNGYVPSDFFTASCVSRRGTNYFWIVRSNVLLHESPDTNDINRAEKELQTFLDGIRFDLP